jgi:hypothetical protein
LGDESVARSFTDRLDGGACSKVRKKSVCLPLLKDALARRIISCRRKILVHFSPVLERRPNTQMPRERIAVFLCDQRLIPAMTLA